MRVLVALQSFLFENGMRGRAIRSTGFTVLRFGGQNVLRLASNLVLTRLLFPEAFGIMAIVQLVLYGVTMFSEFGIRGSIIRDERGDEPDFLNTAWTLQIVRGFLLGLVIAVGATPIAEFYEIPIVAEILLVLAVVPIIQGFTSTRLATASRKLFLGRMVALQLGAQFVGILVMIALAWWLESVWALVIGSIVGPMMNTVLSHLVIPGIRNRIMIDRDAFRQIFGFGKYVFLATVAGFFVNQGDKAVLGKFVTLDTLAIYNIAFFLATVPNSLARALNQAVIFPLYARRPPSESPENRRKINRARFLITGLLMAGLAVLGLLGDWLVRLLYDARYYEAGPMMILISIAAMPRLIVLTYDHLPLAAGHSGRFAALLITRALLQLSLIYLGARFYGITGVILAPMLATVLFYPFLVLSVRRYGGWDIRHDAFYYALAVSIAVSVFVIHQGLFLNMLSEALAGG